MKQKLSAYLTPTVAVLNALAIMWLCSYAFKGFMDAINNSIFEAIMWVFGPLAIITLASMVGLFSYYVTEALFDEIFEDSQEKNIP